MGIFDFLKRNKRSEPVDDIKNGMLINLTEWLNDCSVPRGYKTLAEVPEIKSAIEKIAEVVSTMTIHLMENSDNGDIRIKNELAKKIDIRPNNYMSRQLLISWIVQEMLLNGNAIAMPKTKQGLLSSIDPIEKGKYELKPKGLGYFLEFENGKIVQPDKVLHFRFNPDLKYPWIGRGQKVILSGLKDDLFQANQTVKDFMANKMFPNVVIRVDASTEELSTETGRETIERRYLQRAKAGQPWIIPSDMLDIQQIKPLTLNDIAIHESIKLNKETVASILGVPAFLLGVGNFNRDEYNHFIRNKIAVICKAIESELTEKLLISKNLYFKFNRKSMFNYDLKELGGLYTNLYIKGLVTGNEVRDVLGLSPLDGLDELVILENFIPVDKIGDQKKLGGDENSEDV